MALISNNINRLGKTATFNNNPERWSKFNTETRTKKNSLRMRKPDGQNYDCLDINYKSPRKFEFQKQVDRIDQTEANKELKFEYKNRLEYADYSSFKIEHLGNFDISKVEERDAVSFYKPLARQMKAAKMKMDQAEYTKKLLEFKSGKFEHAIFL